MQRKWLLKRERALMQKYRVVPQTKRVFGLHKGCKDLLLLYCILQYLYTLDTQVHCSYKEIPI